MSDENQTITVDKALFDSVQAQVTRLKVENEKYRSAIAAALRRAELILDAANKHVPMIGASASVRDILTEALRKDKPG